MNDENLDSHIKHALREAADRVQVRDRLTQIRGYASLDRPPTWRSRPLMAGVASFVAAIVLVGGVLLVLRAFTDETDEVIATTAPPTTAAAVDTSTSTTLLEPVVETTSATGGSETGYDAVEAALAEAQDLWASTTNRNWGYLLEIDCDCSEAGNSWVRRWADLDPPQSIRELDGLFARIASAIESQPDVIEVEFSVADGHPVSYRTVDGDSEFVLTINHFHKITNEPTPYDGEWKFIAGSVDGTTFGNPPRYIVIRLQSNWIDYPILCNQASGKVDIYGNFFGFGLISQTLAGCGESPEEEVLFEEAMRRIGTIALDGDTLVLSGPDTELRFGDPPPDAELLGELELTSAGALLSFDPPGDSTTTTYIITSRLDDFGRSVSYLLEAASPGSATPATWERWLGEPEDTIPVSTGPGPHTIAIPDDIHVGDYYLCSPYWQPDPYCLALPVHLPSAPWFVTAGPQGVVLFDANGTTQRLTEEPATIAFHIDDRLIWQALDQPDRIRIDNNEVQLQPGETILDAAVVNGRLLALVTGPDGSATLDIDSRDRIAIGPQALAGRLSDISTILRTASNTVEARDLSGAQLWSRTVDPDAMVHPNDQGLIRLDTFGVLQSDAGPEIYYQYIATELLDPLSGETIDSYEREVAIPDEGHHIGEPCGRTEFNEGLLLCPQPDGRIVTLNVNTDNTRTLTDSASTATYARSDR